MKSILWSFFIYSVGVAVGTDMEKTLKSQILNFDVSPPECKLNPEYSRKKHKYYVVVCPEDVKRATLDFETTIKTLGSKNMTVYSRSKTAISKSTYNLYASKPVVAMILICDKMTKKQCAQYEVDLYKSDPQHFPHLSELRVSSGRFAKPFYRYGYSYIVDVDPYDTIKISALASYGSFVGTEDVKPYKGYTDQHLIFDVTPKEDNENFVITVVNKDRHQTRQYRMIFKFNKKLNPRLQHMSVSQGRLEPRFQKTHYGYYWRVKDQTNVATINLSGINEMESACSINGVHVDYHTNFGVSGLLNDGSIVVECIAGKELVRYLIAVVQQAGGETLMTHITPIGPPLNREFDPQDKDPYVIHINNDDREEAFIGFQVETANKNAKFYSEGRHCSNNDNISPFFYVPLGEERTVNIGIRTEENPVEEVYKFNIFRDAKKTCASYNRVGRSLAKWATVVSAFSPVSFIGTVRFIQTLSALGNINGHPEIYDCFLEAMHPWNLQFKSSRVKATDPNNFGESITYDIVRTKPDELLKIMNNGGKNEQAGKTIVDNSVDITKLGHTFGLDLFENDETKAASRSLLKSDFAVQLNNLPQYSNMDDDTLKRRLESTAMTIDKLVGIVHTDRVALMKKLDARSNDLRKFLNYATSLYYTVSGILIAFVIYAVLWVCVLKGSNFFSLRQDYFDFLQPYKFWIFIFDLTLIPITQSSIGLSMLSHYQFDVNICGHTLSSSQLRILSLLLITIYVSLFVFIGPVNFIVNRANFMWSKNLHFYHDKSCTELSAIRKYFASVPILNQFLKIRIDGVAPITAPDKTYSRNLNFEDCPDIDVPWRFYDINKVEDRRDIVERYTKYKKQEINDLDAPSLAELSSLLAADQKTDKKGRMKVLFYDQDDDNEYKNGWDHHEINNRPAISRHPDAVCGYNTFNLKNSYDRRLETNVEIQLQHLPIIAQTLTRYTLQAPPSNLRFESLERVYPCVANTYKDYLFYWPMDRAIAFLLLVLVNCYSDTHGNSHIIMFVITFLGLFLISVRALSQSATAIWSKNVCQRSNELNRKELEKNSCKMWPLNDAQGMRKYKIEEAKIDKSFFGLYGYFRIHIFEPMKMFLNDKFLYSKYYTFMTEMFRGAGLGELMMLLGLINLVTARSLPWNSDFLVLGFMLCVSLGLTSRMRNRNFSKEIRKCVVEVYVITRRMITFFVSCFKDQQNLQKRLSAWIRGLPTMVLDGNVYDLYSGEIIERRDYDVKKVLFVQNDLGVQLPGKISYRKALKTTFMNSFLDVRRHVLQKSVYKYGRVNPWRFFMDRQLPIQISFKQFAARRLGLPKEHISRLAATFHIINHSPLRFGFKEQSICDVKNDSFLSLYTDPLLIPPQGDIRVPHNNGHSVHYDNKSHCITVRGPAIQLGVKYTITYDNQTTAPNYFKLVSFASSDRTSSSSSSSSSESDDSSSDSEVQNRVSDGDGHEVLIQCKCSTSLTIRVTNGSYPQPGGVIKVKGLDGVTFDIDTKEIECIYDRCKSTYDIFHKEFVEGEKYKVIYRTFNDKEMMRGSGVAEELGKVVIKLDKSNPNLYKPFNLVDDKKVSLLIDPGNTDSYDVILPHRTFSGLTNLTFGIFSQLHRLFCQLKGQKPTNILTTVPCTILQCVDPRRRIFRVEPNFDAALRRQNAKMEELLGLLKLMYHAEDEMIQKLAHKILDNSEIIKLFQKKSVETLHEGVYYNPLTSYNLPFFKDQKKQIDNAMFDLKEHSIKKLKLQCDDVHTQYAILEEWGRAYGDRQLISLQNERDEAESMNLDNYSLKDIVRRIRELKKPYEKRIGGFVFPLTINESMIARTPKIKQQFKIWRKTIEAWYRDEEGASGQLLNSITEESMRALEQTFLRAEDSFTGQFRSCLHFVCDSSVIRGLDVKKRPDPLEADDVKMRVFSILENGKPDYRRGVWLPCCLKLGATKIKILMPNRTDIDRKFRSDYPWKHISGYYIPLFCIDEFVLSEGPLDPSDEFDHEASEFFRAKIKIKRRYDIQEINDQYVKRIEDDEFDNEIRMTDVVGRDADPYGYCIMLGHTVSAQDSQIYSNSFEHERLEEGSVNVHPLTFRCNQDSLKKWKEALHACEMANNGQLDADRRMSALQSPGDDIETADTSVTGKSPMSVEGQISADIDSLANRMQTIVSGNIPNKIECDETYLDDPEYSDYKYNRYEGDFFMMMDALQIGETAEKHLKVPISKELEATINSITERLHSLRDLEDTIKEKNVGRQAKEITDAQKDETVKTLKRKFAQAAHLVEITKYRGGYINNLYHGYGKLYDSNHECVYDGFWSYGLRWGCGMEEFVDRHYCRWRYEGNFVEDEVSGQGVAQMLPSSVQRVVESPDFYDYNVPVTLKGTFSTNSDIKRKYSGVPLDVNPIVNDKLLKEMILHTIKLYKNGFNVNVEESYNSIQRYTKNNMAFDVRRSYSASPDNFLDYPLDITRTDGPNADALVEAQKIIRYLDPTWGFEESIDRFVHGQVTYADESSYIGEIKNGYRQGNGYWEHSKWNIKYQGQWENDLPSGYGSLEWGWSKDQRCYKGEFKDCKRHGYGILWSKSSDIYIEGIWKDDRFEGGKNCIVYFDSVSQGRPFQQYMGEMNMGMPNKNGKMLWYDGIIYVGNFHHGQRSQHGQLYSKKGELLFSGNWKADVPCGRAYYMRNNGEIYRGDMVEGRRQGMGELFDQDGKCIYSGSWVNDLPEGRGTSWGKDGKYQGSWKQGQRHGTGYFEYYKDPTETGKSRRYAGEWKDDLPQGVGRYLSEHGHDAVFKFREGNIEESSMTVYKQGMCTTKPKMGLAPKVHRTNFTPAREVDWGITKLITGDLIVNHITKIACLSNGLISYKKNYGKSAAPTHIIKHPTKNMTKPSDIVLPKKERNYFSKRS